MFAATLGINVTKQPTPVLSVCIQTYNHAPYIGQALDSVLAQRTDFPIEIVVGEDGSTDGTREIVCGYAERYPEIIRALLNDRSNVIYVNGRPTGRWNFMNNIREARGEFVALLDGDDFWTNESKLQIQVNALREAPDCSFSFHNAEQLDQSSGTVTGVYHPEPLPARHYVCDIARRFFIPSCSVVFKKGLFGEFPEWFSRAAVADWPLHVLNAQHGPALYVPNLMATHRIHRGGIWTATPRRKMLLEMIDCAATLRRHISPNCDHEFCELQREMSQELAELAAADGDWHLMATAIRKTYQFRGQRSMLRHTLSLRSVLQKSLNRGRNKLA